MTIVVLHGESRFDKLYVNLTMIYTLLNILTILIFAAVKGPVIFRLQVLL